MMGGKVVSWAVAAVLILAGDRAALAADDIALKLCPILVDVGSDAGLSAEDAKKAFADKLSEAFYDTPQLLGQVFVKGDAIATDACPDARTTALAKFGVNYLSEAMP